MRFSLRTKERIELAAIIGFVVLVLGTAMWFILTEIKEEAAEQQAFMDECLQEHKQYECTAMWRSGNTNTAVLPVFVPVR